MPALRNKLQYRSQADQWQSERRAAAMQIILLAALRKAKHNVSQDSHVGLWWAVMRAFRARLCVLSALVLAHLMIE
jgi:hypothetical protein